MIGCVAGVSKVEQWAVIDELAARKVAS